MVLSWMGWTIQLLPPSHPAKAHGVFDVPGQALDPYFNRQKILYFLLVAHCHSRGCPQYELFE